MTFGDSAQLGIVDEHNDSRERFVGIELGSVAFDARGRTILASSLAGDRLLILDAKSEATLSVISLSSRLGSEFSERGIQFDFNLAPLLPVSERLIFLAPWISDRADRRTPLLAVDPVAQHIDVYQDELVRFPYSIHKNPVLPELYVVGYDFTVIFDLSRRTVTHVLGPGRLTGFAVAPDGSWALGVTLRNEMLLAFDLRTRAVTEVPLKGGVAGELVAVPVVFSEDSRVAAAPDVTANQVVIVELRT
jgi:hypothetical protein